MKTSAGEVALLMVTYLESPDLLRRTVHLVENPIRGNSWGSAVTKIPSQLADLVMAAHILPAFGAFQRLGKGLFPQILGSGAQKTGVDLKHQVDVVHHQEVDQHLRVITVDQHPLETRQVKTRLQKALHSVVQIERSVFSGHVAPSTRAALPQDLTWLTMSPRSDRISRQPL